MQDNCRLAAESVFQQIISGIDLDNIELLLVHVSVIFDLQCLITELNQYFQGVEICGCTSSGEFCRSGYVEHSMVAVAFSRGDFIISAGFVPDLSNLNLSQAQKLASQLRIKTNQAKASVNRNTSFVLSFLDGLSLQEETFLATFAPLFGNLAHLGASAGDDLRLESTWVLYNGHWYKNAAILLLVNTTKAFSVFSVDHINSPVSKLIVTNADPETRTVFEINGEPAASYYAKLIGKRVEDLTPDIFSVFPLAVMVGKKYFIRSIQKVDPVADSLTFYCAVDIGIILTSVQLGDSVDAIRDTLTECEKQLGEPEIVYSCECFLRRLELNQNNRVTEVRELQSQYNLVGFNAYGEHISSIHLNQTFTGVYFSK